MKKNILRVVLGLAILALLAGAIRVGMIWNKTRDVLPQFTPTPAGARAPELTWAGFKVGATTFAEVEAATTKAGFSCRDTSMRGLMQFGRTEAQKKIAEAKESGVDPDTVSGASRAYYYSKKEQNPQIQWSCEDVDLSKVDTYFAGATSSDDLTFVFDSKGHPLRYIVTSRKFQSQAAARAARDASIARLSATLGPPQRELGHIDERPGEKLFARLQIVASDWQYADRHVGVTVMNLGPAKGIDVREVVEVPWPVEVQRPGG